MSFYYEKALWQCHLRGRNNLVDGADRLTGKQASRGKSWQMVRTSGRMLNRFSHGPNDGSCRGAAWWPGQMEYSYLVINIHLNIIHCEVLGVLQTSCLPNKKRQGWRITARVLISALGSSRRYAYIFCGGFRPALLLLTAILWWPLKEIEYNFVC